MIRGILLGTVCAAGATLLLASPAAAADFVNGSFETNTCGVPGGGFTTVLPGNSCITGWEVGPHSVDLVGTYWQAKDGIMSVDLGGSAAGSISQTFDTVAGTLYLVNYWLSGNPDGGDIGKFGLVAAVDGVTLASSNFLGLQSTRANMNYALWEFEFTAAGPQTTLSFAADPSEGAFGPVLDNVTVRGVPEPGTWATMLLGFGLIGFGLRKRNAKRGQRRIRVAYA